MFQIYVMAEVEMNFAKLKKDERCKRLERSLKLSMLKRSGDSSNADTSKNNSNTYNWSFSMFSESTRIEDKNTFFNNNEQRIMTTEDNKRRIMEKNKQCTSYKSRIASSDDKKSPEQDNCFNNNGQKVMVTKMNKYISYEPTIAFSSTKKSPQRNNCFDKNDATPLNTYKYLGQSKRNSINSPTNEKSFMRFYNWKVILNQDYKLVIKGRLESGEIACSKPIIRRLTARSIQSICLSVYHLEGNIVDKENELPKYVRGKFYNGFPDDWENVYLLWQSFVFNNDQVNFHWPTKITDSDDDLNSEVTMQSIHIDDDKYLKSPNKICINDTDHTTKINIDNNLSNLETSVPNLTNIPIPNSTKKVHDSKIFNKENRQEHNNVANITQCLNVRNQRSLLDIIKEDKINIIVNNLQHKNCPNEYIVKILQMFNCLEDVFSYKIESNDANKEQRAYDDSKLYSSHLHSKETLRRSYVPEHQNTFTIKKSVDHNNHNIVNMHTSQNTILQEQSRNSLQRTNIKDSEDFESQVYGTPKIEFEKVLEKRRALLQQDKERKRKAIMNSTSKDSIKSQKKTKTKDRSAHHSNFNDINIEDNIKYSVLDDRIKKGDKAIKCNALEQQKDIKRSKTTSCPQGFVTYEKNLGKVYNDDNISIIEDETSEVNNMNRNKTSHRRKKSNFDNKYDNNISITDDEEELPRTNYKKHLNTIEITKRSTKKPREINTFNGTDHYLCI
ncbi:hypothetical protein M0804_008177 [Polistes exclamans]|nr:hypothetical protein M0804_008177 [Polistes exclamans]